MDLENLSKIKKIYNVYTCYDNNKKCKILHVESFPVVYINHKYIYFVRPEQDDLARKYMSGVEESAVRYISALDKNQLENIDSILHINMNFWCIECDKDAAINTYNSAVKNVRASKLREKRETVKQEFIKMKNMYTKALQNAMLAGYKIEELLGEGND